MRRVSLQARAQIIWLVLMVLMSNNVSAQNIPSDVQEIDDYILKYSIETNARTDKIWSLWTDVQQWKRFDTLLEYAYLTQNTPMTLGSVGYLKAQGGIKTKFEVIQMQSNKSLVLSLKLPFYQVIELHRYVELSSPEKNIISHEVHFKGALRSMYYAMLSRTFKKELQLVMGRLKVVAENE